MKNNAAETMRQQTKLEPQAGPNPLPLEDWDFHEIEPWEIRAALRHEYARECREKMEQLAQWMTPEWYAFRKQRAARRIAAVKANDKAALRKCSEEMVSNTADVLAMKLKESDFAEPLIDAMIASLEWGMDWRQPWLKQRGMIIEDVKRLDSAVKIPKCAFVEKYPPHYFGWTTDIACLAARTTPPKSNPEQRHWWNKHDASRYVLHIDWCAVKRARNPKNNLVKSIRQALQMEWESQSERRMGRQAAEPFHKLRALAAWRWDNAGYSHDDARKLIRQRARMLDLKFGPKKIGSFPDFSDSQHRRKAISETEKELQLLRG